MAYAEEKKRLAEATRALNPATGAPRTVGQGEAALYPEGAKPGPGLNLGPIEHAPFSAPSPSGSNVSTEASTPAAAATNGQQGAGGAGSRLLEDQGPATTPVDKMGVGEVEAALEVSAGHVSKGSAQPEGALATEDPDIQAANIADQKDKLNKGLIANGTNPQRALEQLRDQRLQRYAELEKEGLITKQTHTKMKDRWKNIFNVIPKEDFGMVLMDFGFRAMMAGETMGDLGALGAAGSGALAGVEARKDRDYDRRFAQEKMAGEEARADLRVGALVEEQQRRAPDTLTTEQGIFVYDPDKGAYSDTPLKDSKGTTLTPSALAGKPPVDKWKIDRLVASGVPRDKAERYILYGVNPVEARQDAMALWARFEGDADATITVGGQTYSKREVRKGQIPGLKQKFIREYLSGLGFDESEGGGALTPNAGGYQWKTDRPDGWSDSQWDDYQEARRQATGQ